MAAYTGIAFRIAARALWRPTPEFRIAVSCTMAAYAGIHLESSKRSTLNSLLKSFLRLHLTQIISIKREDTVGHGRGFSTTRLVLRLSMGPFQGLFISGLIRLWLQLPTL